MVSRERGGAVIEVALMTPWIFFLFVGILDFGFYSYAAICTQTAARAGAMATSGDPSMSAAQYQTLACAAATAEMKKVPNAGSFSATCNASPLTVVQASQTTTCPDYDATNNPTVTCTSVTITYQSINMIPIPGILAKQLNLTRIEKMRFDAP